MHFPVGSRLATVGRELNTGLLPSGFYVAGLRAGAGDAVVQAVLVALAQRSELFANIGGVTARRIGQAGRMGSGAFLKHSMFEDPSFGRRIFEQISGRAVNTGGDPRRVTMPTDWGDVRIELARPQRQGDTAALGVAAEGAAAPSSHQSDNCSTSAPVEVAGDTVENRCGSLRRACCTHHAPVAPSQKWDLPQERWQL